ncbi:MAG: ABC transporter substrate-binding protein, partial [Afipia sp.]|nr:ABC transporter substrate-binding protein [Afipia sp.]
MTRISRRHVLVLGGGAAVACVLKPAMADDAGFSHGMSAFGDLKYPKDFRQFDYVNADAPKGGLFSTIPSSRSYNQSFQTFNSLNAFILKGDGAIGIEQTFTTLM